MTDMERGDVWQVPVVKGVWTAGRDDPKKNRRPVFMTCPKCGMISNISPGWIFRVLPDGQVDPSFKCPCGFRDQVTLKGWKP